MLSAYEDFDVLSSAEMLKHVQRLKLNSLTCWLLAKSLMEHSAEQKNRAKVRQYATAVKNSLAQFHLCDFFLKSKDSHDTEFAIMELRELDAQRVRLAEDGEFEAAARMRDKIEKIREYLSNKPSENESYTSVIGRTGGTV